MMLVCQRGYPIAWRADSLLTNTVCTFSRKYPSKWWLTCHSPFQCKNTLLDVAKGSSIMGNIAYNRNRSCMLSFCATQCAERCHLQKFSNLHIIIQHSLLLLLSFCWAKKASCNWQKKQTLYKTSKSTCGPVVCKARFCHLFWSIINQKYTNRRRAAKLF